MIPIVFAAPGRLDTPTGGYAYDREIVARLPAHGCEPRVIDLGEGFPFPEEPVRRAAEAALCGARESVAVVDGLALGVLPDAAAHVAAAMPLIALVHHPLAHETGLDAERAAALRASERAALRPARAVVATSDFTARLLARDYEVAADRITVVRPGRTAAVSPAARKSRDTEEPPISLLAVGSLVPRKGHDVLLAALATLRGLPWRLTVVGEARDTATAARLADCVAENGLADRVAFAGAVAQAELRRLYAESDAFVLASHFEGYGMAFAEALAHGLPIVGTTGGAIPETVPRDAGLLIPPGDVAAFAGAVCRLIEDAPLQARLSAAALRAARALPTWDDAARDVARVIARLA